MNNPTVDNIDELKTLAGGNQSLYAYVALNGSLVSYKHIPYYPKDDSWEIHHDICDSWESYDSTDEFMMYESIIIEAMSKRALFNSGQVTFRPEFDSVKKGRGPENVE